MQDRNPGLTDDQVIEIASHAENGEKVKRLLAGDLTDYFQDINQEENAQLGLCRILAFYTGDNPKQIEAIVNASGMSQYDTWKRGSNREPTILKAIEDQKKVGFFRSVTQCNQDSRRVIEPTKPNLTVSKDDLDLASAWAGELAVQDKGMKTWNASFRLARSLRQLTSHNPEQFEQAVTLYCQTSGRDFNEFYYDFLFVWDRVRQAVGDDVLTWAASMSEREPYTPNPCFGEPYRRVAGIAWHLWESQGREKPFWLPCPRLASLLKTNKMTVSRIIGLLKKHGVIECVDDSYQFRKTKDGDKKCKEYIFTGPSPIRHNHAA